MTIQKKTGVVCLATLLLALSILSGCTNAPIFADIEKEVEYKEPTMQGTIISLEVVGGNIYVSNGYLFCRSGGTGSWNLMSAPDGTERSAELASDGTYLYARFTQASDHTKFQSVRRYNTATGSWTTVGGLDNVRYIGSGNGIIYAFTENSGTYQAYVNDAANKDSFVTTAIATGLAVPVDTAGDYVATTGAVYRYDGASKKLDKANGTYSDSVTTSTAYSPSGVTGIAVNGANLYAVKSSYVLRYDGTAWTWKSHSAASPTTGISYLGGTSGKSLLLISSGTLKGGYSEVVVAADGSLGDSIITPGDSSLSTVPIDRKTQYENTIGLWAVRRVYALTSPIQTGDKFTLYASVINQTYNGLWSFYSSTTQWNRE